MADNVGLTPGAGVSIGTDDCSAAGHVQRIKLCVSADGNGTHIPADATYGLDVDVTRLPALAAGSNAIGKLAANSGVVIGDVNVVNKPTIQGTVAHDAAAADYPVQIGAYAVNRGDALTEVSNAGDVVRLAGTRSGRLYVCEGHPKGDTYETGNIGAAATNLQLVAAPGAGLSIYVTDIIFVNIATAGLFTLLDGSGGTVKVAAQLAVNTTLPVKLTQPIKLTANTALCLTSATVTTHRVFVGYYIGA